MKLEGGQTVSLTGIRALAVECHALDLSAKELLCFPIQCDDTGLTRATYDEFLTSKMLALAIALRTKFYSKGDLPGCAGGVFWILCKRVFV